jgi:hypothetical protein
MSLRDATQSYWGKRLDLSEGYRNNAIRGIEMHLAELLDTPVGNIDKLPCFLVCSVSTLAENMSMCARYACE